MVVGRMHPHEGHFMFHRGVSALRAGLDVRDQNVRSTPTSWTLKQVSNTSEEVMPCAQSGLPVAADVFARWVERDDGFCHGFDQSVSNSTSASIITASAFSRG
jgi:hypothetical protein